MARALKITAIVLGSLLGLIVLAVGVLLLVIDPNDYKPQLTALVKEKTAMTLAIEDRLEWTLWPSIGVELGRSSLRDAEKKETLVAVEKAGVSVALLPLFRRQINIDAVMLDGAKVRHLRYADGTTSWDRMLARLASPGKEEEEPSQAVAFNVKTLEVKDSSLYMKDEKAGVERALEAVAVQAQDIGMGEPFPLGLQFTFSQKDAEGKTLLAKNTLAGTVTLDQDKKLYVLDGLDFASALSGTALPAPADISLKGKVTADMAAQKVAVGGLQLSANYQDKALKSPATVTLSADVLADLGQTLLNVSKLQLRASYPEATRPQPVSAALAGNLSTNWTTGELDAPQLALNAVVPGAAYPKPLQVSLNMPVKGNWMQGSFSLPKFVLAAAGVRAEGALEAKLPAMQSTEPETPITKGMVLSGSLAVAPFNPRGVMAALGIAAPKTADTGVLKRASLTAGIQGDEQRVLLKNLKITLDETTLTGEAGISDLATLRQYARLSLDRIDVDRYLPPEAPAAPANAQTTPPAAKPAAAADLLPVDLLKSQNLDVALSAGSLKIMTYPISGFRLAATAGKGVVNVSEFKGNIFKGGFSAPVSIDVQGAQPVLKLQPRLDGMEIGPLARKLLKKDLLEGRASYNGTLTLRGNSTAAWMQSVSGTSDLKFENGLLHGVNAMKELNDALGKYQALLALAGKDLAAEAEKQNDTEIANFAAQNTLDNGVVNSKALSADLKKAKVAGSGNFNLVTQQLDYRFGLNLDKSVAGGRYSGYEIPVQCKGSLAGSMASLCKLDSKAIADLALKAAAGKGLEKLGLQGGTPKEAVQQKVEEEKAKAKEEAKEKLNEELGKGLQKLFGR
ncbi:MAG: AsmA family protein [Pseudomonadota bacterium]